MQTVLNCVSAALFLTAAALSLRALFLPGADFACFSRDRRGERAVFLAALLLGALMAGAVVLRAMALFPGAGPLEALGRFFGGGLLDARHYRSLALWGYGRGEDFFDQQLMIVFFPLFPWLMRLICLTGLPFYPAAMVMNLLLFAAGAALTFRIAARRWGRHSGLFAAAFAALAPGAFFFVLPMTEALFFFLCALFFDAVETRRWPVAALAGLGAGLTRLPGAALTALGAAVFFCALRRGRREWGALAATLAPLAGTAGYLALNAAVFGNPLQFLLYQRQHWHNRPGLFWQTAGSMWRMFLSWQKSDPPLSVYVGLWTALALVAALVLLAAAARRLPPGWALAALAYFAAVSASNWMPSGVRYLLCLPALGPALALAAKRWRRPLLLCLTALAGTAYFAAFLSGAPIF